MKVNLEEIEKGGVDIDFSGSIKEPGIIETIGNVVAHLHIGKDLNEIQVSGEIKGKLKLQCSRCLCYFHKKVKLNIELSYLPIEDINKEEKYEIRKDESNISYYKGDELNITEVIQEQLLLNIPIKPLCEENCKGLCPICGANLNIENCDCKKEQVDYRFSILKEFFKRKEC